MRAFGTMLAAAVMAATSLCAGAGVSSAERLRQNLLAIGRSSRFVWGNTIYEENWKDGAAVDVGKLRRETGLSPILYSADFRDVFGTFLSPGRYAENQAKLAAIIKREYDERHAVPIISWHFANPYTPPGWKAYSRSSQPFRYR